MRTFSCEPGDLVLERGQIVLRVRSVSSFAKLAVIRSTSADSSRVG